MAERKLPEPSTPDVDGIRGMDLPGNSIKSNDDASAQKKVDKVVKGHVTIKKKSLGRKFVDTFFGEDVVDVKGYIINDVLIPALKNTIDDVVSDGIKLILFGEVKGGNSRKGNGRPYVSYDRAYSKDRREDCGRASSRARYEFGDAILDNRGDAEEILSNLVDIIEDYGAASVADLHDMLGVTGAFTDNYWGWTDLSNATVRRVREGYLLDLPKTVSLKN